MANVDEELPASKHAVKTKKRANVQSLVKKKRSSTKAKKRIPSKKKQKDTVAGKPMGKEIVGEHVMVKWTDPDGIFKWRQGNITDFSRSRPTYYHLVEYLFYDLEEEKEVWHRELFADGFVGFRFIMKPSENHENKAET